MSEYICFFKGHDLCVLPDIPKEYDPSFNYYRICSRCGYKTGTDLSLLMKLHWFIKEMIDPKPFTRKKILQYRWQDFKDWIKNEKRYSQ